MGNPGGVAPLGRHVASALAHDESGDIMRIAGADGRDFVTVIQQRKPIAKTAHEVGLQRAGIRHFHGVEGEGGAAQIVARDRVEILRTERDEAIMNVPRMIQDHDASSVSGGGAHRFHERRPLGQFEVRNGRGHGGRGEGDEMTELRRDFIRRSPA